MLVGVSVRGAAQPWKLEESLDELAMLARTAGAEVVARISQNLPRPERHYLGSGKLAELQDLVHESHAGTVICDDELNPNQQRALENTLNVKVIDRTALILDVFGRHAHTREGQLQVELAQHQYLLPRLVGQWSHLERLGGGIGTRGPGETQLETDRRLIQRRIQKLQLQLDQVRKRRQQYRLRRHRAGIAVASLVGYTNAGKSTLFNALSDAEVPVRDQLFSTLDPVTRQITLSEDRRFLLTDTVGFIQKLSPTVVAAFRATLEELEGSDLLLHVVDIMQPHAAEQAEAVDATLRELGLQDTPRLLVVNKMDLLTSSPDGEAPRDTLPLDDYPSVLVSAAKGWNLGELLEMVCERLGLESGETYAQGLL